MREVIFIFDSYMNSKSYIAVFFAIVFFGKFLMMDSSVLVAIIDSDEIVNVNPLCIKQNAKKIEGRAEGSFSVDSKKSITTIPSFCNAPFNFDISNWEFHIVPEESQPYAYHTPILPELTQDRFYPPPKI